MCSGLLLLSLGFLLIFVFGGTQHHNMRAWVLLICMDFRRKFISLVIERPCSIFSPWFVAVLLLTQLQWKRIGVSLNFRTLKSKYAPFNWWTPSCMGNITLPLPLKWEWCVTLILYYLKYNQIYLVWKKITHPLKKYKRGGGGTLPNLYFLRVSS